MIRMKLLLLVTLFMGIFGMSSYAAEEKLTLTATASSVYSTSTYYRASNAVDGNNYTYWLGAYNTPPWWISFDAGEIKKIGRINIMWYSSYYVPSNYDIQISNDGINWETLYASLAGLYSASGEDKEINRRARYIRLYIKTTRYYPVVRELNAYKQPKVPRTIRFQGALGDAQGVPLDGIFSLTFKLYDSETAGSLLWQEMQTQTIEGGLLDVELGSVTPLDLPFTKQYWLGVTVDTDPEMQPRFKLTAVPYAIRTEE